MDDRVQRPMLVPPPNSLGAAWQQSQYLWVKLWDVSLELGKQWDLSPDPELDDGSGHTHGHRKHQYELNTSKKWGEWNCVCACMWARGSGGQTDENLGGNYMRQKSACTSNRQSERPFKRMDESVCVRVCAHHALWSQLVQHSSKFSGLFSRSHLSFNRAPPMRREMQCVWVCVTERHR